MKFHKTTLPNGLRVLTVPMPSFESATVMVMVKAGSRFETKENNGISHFLEHMAFKGTKKRPSAFDISTLIDGIGGEFNAFTGKETTGYYIKSSKNHIGLSLDVLSDMLQNSLFDPVEINKEREVILEEINYYEDTPARKISDIFDRLIYGDTPMGWDTAGEKDIIRKIQREDFLRYMLNLYSADNMVIVVAGGVKPDEVNNQVVKHFGQMKKFDIIDYQKVFDEQAGPKVTIKQKTTEQAHIALGVRTVSINSVERFPLMILSIILGGGMSSRLFTEIREKRGLAYYVRTNTEFYLDCGNMVTTAGTDPKKAEEAVKVIVGEYEAIAGKEKRITEHELTKAKELLKGHLVLELEDSRSVAGFYAGQELLEKDVENPDNFIEKVDKINIKDVENMAKTYLIKNNLNLAMIGNFTDGQKFENLLQ